METKMMIYEKKKKKKKQFNEKANKQKIHYVRKMNEMRVEKNGIWFDGEERNLQKKKSCDDNQCNGEICSPFFKYS